MKREKAAGANQRPGTVTARQPVGATPDVVPQVGLPTSHCRASHHLPSEKWGRGASCVGEASGTRRGGVGRERPLPPCTSPVGPGQVAARGSSRRPGLGWKTAGISSSTGASARSPPRAALPGPLAGWQCWLCRQPPRAPAGLPRPLRRCLKPPERGWPCRWREGYGRRLDGKGASRTAGAAQADPGAGSPGTAWPLSA